MNDTLKKLLGKLLGFAHSKLGKLATQLSTVLVAWLIGAGIVPEARGPETLAAVALIIGLVVDWAVHLAATRFIKDKQMIASIKADGYAGPETRAAHGLKP